jgi:DNA-binding FadR family transcriptional regulator
MPFAPVKKQKISEQVAASIRDAIVTGQVRPSDALPSERELAERFQVNRSSIREALHRLEAWGLVEIRQGNQTVVRDFLVTAGPELLVALATASAPDPKIVYDLLAIRSMILAWTARQAARAAADRDLTRLRELTEALEQPDQSAEQLQILDFEFFQELVSLTENRVLGLLANTIRQVYLAQPALFTPLYEPARFDARRHRRAFAAIVAGDAEAAAAAMEEYAQSALGPAVTGGAGPSGPTNHEPGGRP